MGRSYGHGMSSVNELVITRDLEVPLSDGTILRADLHRPAGDGPFPTLLQRTPYVKDFNPGLWVVIDPLKAAAAGFAVLIQDVRGRGRSDGEFRPFVDEAADGADTLTWIAEQPWSDGRIAMYGSSYMAAAAWQAAKAAPERLFAMCPFQASSDFFEGRSYRGGAFEIGALLGVSLNALGGAVAHRLAREGVLERSAPRRARAMVDRIPELARTPDVEDLRETILGDIAPFFFDWATKTDPSDEYWRALGIEDAYPDMTMPVLHCSSWFDQAHVGTLRNFEGMRTRTAPEVADRQYLVMGPWAHRVPRGSTVGQIRIGERYFGASAIFDLDRLQLKWLRKILDGDPRPWPHPGRVRVFVMGADTWRNFDEWPPAGTVTTDLHLGLDDSGERAASWETPAGSSAETFTHDPDDPVPTTGGAHMAPEAIFPAGPVDQRAVQARDDVLTFTSEPLTDAVEVIGWVEAELHVSTPEPADWSITLSEVLPDGRRLNVCDGYLRAPDDAVGDEARLVRISLGATAQRFEAGNRISVHVAGSSSPRHPVRGIGSAPSDRTVHTGGDTPSRILLPVLPADEATPKETA